MSELGENILQTFYSSVYLVKSACKRCAFKFSLSFRKMHKVWICFHSNFEAAMINMSRLNMDPVTVYDPTNYYHLTLQFPSALQSIFRCYSS